MCKTSNELNIPTVKKFKSQTELTQTVITEHTKSEPSYSHIPIVKEETEERNLWRTSSAASSEEDSSFPAESPAESSNRH